MKGKQKSSYQIYLIFQWLVLNEICNKLGNFLDAGYEFGVNKRRGPDGGAHELLHVGCGKLFYKKIQKC